MSVYSASAVEFTRSESTNSLMHPDDWKFNVMVVSHHSNDVHTVLSSFYLYMYMFSVALHLKVRWQ